MGCLKILLEALGKVEGSIRAGSSLEGVEAIVDEGFMALLCSLIDEVNSFVG